MPPTRPRPGSTRSPSARCGRRSGPRSPTATSTHSPHHPAFLDVDHALGRPNTFMDGELAQTFVGNHDVSRLATILNDDRHFSHALAVLFCVGGVPGVLHGDEQGFRGLKGDR